MKTKDVYFTRKQKAEPKKPVSEREKFDQLKQFFENFSSPETLKSNLLSVIELGKYILRKKGLPLPQIISRDPKYRTPNWREAGGQAKLAHDAINEAQCALLMLKEGDFVNCARFAFNAGGLRERLLLKPPPRLGKSRDCALGERVAATLKAVAEFTACRDPRINRYGYVNEQLAMLGLTEFKNPESLRTFLCETKKRKS